MFHRLLDDFRHILYKVYSRFMDDITPSVLLSTGLGLGLPIQEAMMTNGPAAIEVSVTSIEFRKMDAAPYHEFVVFTVEEDCPRQTKAIIIVDRFVGENVPREWLQDELIPADSDPAELMYSPNGRPRPGQQLDPIDYQPGKRTNSGDKRRTLSPVKIIKESAESVSLSSLKMVASLFPERPSKDLVTLVVEPNSYLEDERKGSEVCKTFRIRKGTLSVSELFHIIQAIHNSNRSYHLLRHQCYWFADTLYDVVKQRCGNVKDTVKLADKPGRFGSVRVQRTNGTTPQSILAKHQRNWPEQEVSIRKVSFTLCLGGVCYLKDGLINRRINHTITWVKKRGRLTKRHR